jgi:CBS domain containing-hemolysin-like protein
MITGIFAFDDMLAYEVMTPRTDVFSIDINEPAEEYMDELMELRYSRIPVYEDDSDNIIGILYIKDYLIKAREEGFENVDFRSILRKPYFVPETKKMDSLFYELQTTKQHIAILIDEYGGFSGIVTMEDIIEEIMGDIDDEYDEEERSYVKINDHTYVFEAKTLLSDFYKIVKTDSDVFEDIEGDADTLAGLLLEIKGEFPKLHEKLEYEHFEFEVLEMDARRILKVKVIIGEPKKEKE